MTQTSKNATADAWMNLNFTVLAGSRRNKFEPIEMSKT